MPQASKDLRDLMRKRFGDTDLFGPAYFLEDAGYKITTGYLWEPKPGVKSYGDMTQDELDWLDFLCEEWDYGGLIETDVPTNGRNGA